eukprot:snap_masked-scaffold_75-processed-gene-0.22-mRNA-1 protein AED:1.00 eAED:1.00 QI:0/0/0/0/1/1/2/0/105
MRDKSLKHLFAYTGMLSVVLKFRGTWSQPQNRKKKIKVIEQDVENFVEKVKVNPGVTRLMLVAFNLLEIHSLLKNMDRIFPSLFSLEYNFIFFMLGCVVAMVKNR